jgi:transcriptional regulator with XRE-family HTH domain
VEPREQFGVNVRATRRAAGLSQEELSTRSGLHFTEISRLERGTRDPQLQTIVAIARGLRIPPSELLADIR